MKNIIAAIIDFFTHPAPTLQQRLIAMHVSAATPRRRSK